MKELIWLLAFLFLVMLVLAVVVAAKGIQRVPSGMVGIVHRRFGLSRAADRWAVQVYGSPGPQAEVLKADRTYLGLAFVDRVEYVPKTFVPPGTIGVVVARAGEQPPADRTLCTYVDCDRFQDGRTFLLKSGQMGRQPEVLPGGASYAINTALFEVITVDTIGAGRYGLTAADLAEVSIPVGTTGVVITLDGVAPDEEDEANGMVAPQVPGHQSFQWPWVFLAQGGQRGVQSEILARGGTYRINPWFARVVIIPTRDLILEWTRKDAKSTGNFDAALDQIVVNVEGHRLRFEMSQTIRIPARAAPALVGRFGEQESDRFGVSSALDPTPVQRFVERVLGRTVAGYFQGNAAEYKVLDFITRHDQVRLELEDRVRQALKEWGVEAVRTTLAEFEAVDEDLDKLRRSIAAERVRQLHLEHQRDNVALEAETDEARIRIDRQRLKTDAAMLEEQIRLLGRDTVALERFLTHLAQMNVPQIVGGDVSALLPFMPLSAAQELFNRALRRTDPGAAVTGSPLPDADPPTSGTTANGVSFPDEPAQEPTQEPDGQTPQS